MISSSNQTRVSRFVSSGIGCVLGPVSFLIFFQVSVVLGTSVRVVSYNVDFSDQGNNNNMPAVSSVIQAIGAHTVNGHAQPADVIGLQELLDTNDNSTISTSLPLMVSSLNSTYGAGTYAYVNTPDPTTGGTKFNGPSGLVYDTKTVKVVSATPLAYSGSTLIPRAPMRYLIQPLGYGTDSQFYMYVSHYKSATGSTTTRNNEATEIRADADGLGPNAHIIYSGDHNLYQASSEPSYQTLISAGNGQAHDPNSLTQVWSEDASNVARLSGDSSKVQYAEDLQLTSASVYNQSSNYTVPGLRLASGSGVNSYVIFGNGSSPVVPASATAQPFQGSVNYAGNSTLNDLPNPGAVLANLVTASDHLPVVADYNLVGVTPVPAVWVGSTGVWSSPNNWSTSVVPNNPAVEVQIDGGSSTASVVALDQTAVVADVTIDANDTLNTNASSSLTLSGPAVSTISGKLNVAGNLVVQSNIANSGTISISGNQSWAAGSTLTNTAGSATFSSDAGAVTATMSVSVTGGKVTFNSTEHLFNLNVGSGALIQVTRPTGSSRSVLVTPSIAVSGTLDLTNNDLIVQGSDLNTVTALIGEGLNLAQGGGWNGSIGITSSTAAANTSHLTALGVIINNTGGAARLYGSGTTLGLFDGVNPAINDVLVRYTYFGDSNLNGVVDASDYARIDAGFLAHASGWYNGDFNYDGVVNGSDYTLIDNAFNTQGAAISAKISPAASVTTEIASVPEPTRFGPVVGGFAMFVSYRAKRHSRQMSAS